MNYADITFKDPNFVKRWLQYSRLKTAIHLSDNYLNLTEKYSICDFGSGDGELCKLINMNLIIRVYFFRHLCIKLNPLILTWCINNQSFTYS